LDLKNHNPETQKTLNNKLIAMNKKEQPELGESESNAELPFSEVLSARELQKLSHERRREKFRKNGKTVREPDSWFISKGLLGI
jgi:hypothetical protein